MIEPLSKLTYATYQFMAKPILFRLKPDSVHAHTIRLASWLQRSGVCRRIIRCSLAYDDPGRLAQTLFSVKFANPIGLSAGFDKNFELPPMMRALGFGFMEGGSVTALPCDGNPRPWFHRLPRSKSLVVHVGLANQGVDAVISRLLRYQPAVIQDFPLNVSVAQTNRPSITTGAQAIDDYVSSLQHIQRSGVGQFLTINISCPNTYHGEPFTSSRMLGRLLTRVDALELAQPVFIKMPSHLPWEAFEPLLRTAARHKIAGIIIGNLAKRESGIALADPLPKEIEGGLSGKPTWERSNELIRQTYLTYQERFTIIGVGGVFSAQDAYTKIRLGASLVELITGMIFGGPQLIGRINKELTLLLRRDGFSNVSEAVGVDASNSKDA